MPRGKLWMTGSEAPAISYLLKRQPLGGTPFLDHGNTVDDAIQVLMFEEDIATFCTADVGAEKVFEIRLSTVAVLVTKSLGYTFPLCQTWF